ncbi:hypothetical protein ACH0AH_04060 [Microbacterium paludicola]
MSEQNAAGSGAPRSQTARLVVSWLIVGVPLVYALVQTITSVLPLFAG